MGDGDKNSEAHINITSSDNHITTSVEYGESSYIYCDLNSVDDVLLI